MKKLDRGKTYSFSTADHRQSHEVRLHETFPMRLCRNTVVNEEWCGEVLRHVLFLLHLSRAAVVTSNVTGRSLNVMLVAGVTCGIAVDY